MPRSLKRHRLLWIVTVVGLMALLAACGGGPSTESIDLPPDAATDADQGNAAPVGDGFDEPQDVFGMDDDAPLPSPPLD